MVHCNFLWQVVAVDDTAHIALRAYHISSCKCSGCSCTVHDVSSPSQFLMAAEAFTSVVPPVLYVCLQVEGSQSSWIQTLWTLFMNMDKPKHMPWYRWCKIIWMQHQLHKIALPRGEGQELHQVLHTFKILLYYWGYTVFILICNKNLPFQKINIWKVQFFSELCVFLCAYVCVACLSDGLPKMLPSSNTHVLQTWSVAVMMCCFSLWRTWPQSTVYWLAPGT